MSRIGKNPVTIPAGVQVNIDGQHLTAWIAWGIGFTVYALLGYLTFFYRWRQTDRKSVV